MFKLFDMNMNEIPFPEGVKPLDIFVGSIGKNRYTEEIEGRSGVVDYGFDYTSREINLSLWIISSDTIDYRLLRNELYAFFDKGNAFYVAESNVPSRVLKVAVDDSYIPERLTQMHAQVDITCRTLDSVFWESTYTTLELHDSGFDAVKERYGLVDNIDADKIQYVFTDWNFTVYNAGNVTVEPESMFLNFTLGMVQTNNVFRLTNRTTGDVFEWTKKVNGRNIYIRGINVSEGTAIPYAIRDTNRKFISLAPGDNHFEVSGGTFSRISVDAKFYYK